MEGVTYCLSLNNKNSDKYYREVDSISRDIKNLIINEANNYLDDFIVIKLINNAIIELYLKNK